MICNFLLYNVGIELKNPYDSSYEFYQNQSRITKSDIISTHRKLMKPILRIALVANSLEKLKIALFIVSLTNEYPLFVDPIMLWHSLPIIENVYCKDCRSFYDQRILDVVTEIYDNVSKNKLFTDYVFDTLIDISYYMRNNMFYQCLDWIEYKLKEGKL